jgi:hypothetical protein
MIQLGESHDATFIWKRAFIPQGMLAVLERDVLFRMLTSFTKEVLAGTVLFLYLMFELCVTE